MTEPTPQDTKLQSFQDLTQGYQRKPRERRSDALPNTSCGLCGSNSVYKTLNYLYTKALPFNCVNCGLIKESNVIQG